MSISSPVCDVVEVMMRPRGRVVHQPRRIHGDFADQSLAAEQAERVVDGGLGDAGCRCGAGWPAADRRRNGRAGRAPAYAICTRCAVGRTPCSTSCAVIRSRMSKKPGTPVTIPLPGNCSRHRRSLANAGARYDALPARPWDAHIRSITPRFPDCNPRQTGLPSPGHASRAGTDPRRAADRDRHRGRARDCRHAPAARTAARRPHDRPPSMRWCTRYIWPARRRRRTCATSWSAAASTAVQCAPPGNWCERLDRIRQSRPGRSACRRRRRTDPARRYRTSRCGPSPAIAAPTCCARMRCGPRTGPSCSATSAAPPAPAP